MKSFRFALAVVFTFTITVPSYAANILLVSDACVPDSGCGTNQRDDTFVSFLEDLGHVVDTSGMAGAYRSADAWWTNGDKSAAVSDADLVIVSRRTGSGDYRGAIATHAWNGLDTPLLLMSAYITRGSRWGWQVDENIDGTASMETEMEILIPDSPLVRGFDSETVSVFDWTGPSIGGTETDTPGTWPKNVTGPAIGSVVEGGNIVGQFADRAFLVHYPAGSGWRVTDDGEGGTQDGEFAADRVYMGHWGYDIQNAAGEPFNFLDLTTGGFLEILTNTINTLVPPPVVGPGCDFDTNGVCNVTDIDMLLNAIGSDNAMFDLDSSGGPVTLSDRDAWLTQAGQAAVPPLVLVPGDSDLDGDVDAGDLNNLGVAWQRTDNPGWGNGDFNGDDVVNAGDLNDLGVTWLHPRAGAGAAAAAVPESSSIGLLLMSLIGLLGLRRR